MPGRRASHGCPALGVLCAFCSLATRADSVSPADARSSAVAKPRVERADVRGAVGQPQGPRPKQRELAQPAGEGRPARSRGRESP